MTSSITKTLDISNVYRKWIFIALSGALMLFALVYFFFVHQTVLYAVERENIEASIAIYGADVTDLQFKVLEARDQLTIDRAKTLGFGSTEPQYVTKRSLGIRMTSANEI